MPIPIPHPTNPTLWLIQRPDHKFLSRIDRQWVWQSDPQKAYTSSSKYFAKKLIQNLNLK